MDFDIQEGIVVFTFEGQTYSRGELKKLFEIVKDLSETNDYEWPYRGPDLQSRALTIIAKSKR